MKRNDGKKGDNTDNSAKLFVARSPSGGRIQPRQDFQYVDGRNMPPQDWNHDTNIDTPKQRTNLEGYYPVEERRQPSIPSNSRPSSANTIRSKSVSRKPSSGMPQLSYEQLLEKSANLATTNFALKFENESLKSQIDEFVQQGERMRNMQKPIDLTEAYNKLGKKYNKLKDLYRGQASTIGEMVNAISEKDAEISQLREMNLALQARLLRDKPIQQKTYDDDSLILEDDQSLLTDDFEPEQTSHPVEQIHNAGNHFQGRSPGNMEFFEQSYEIPKAIQRPQPPKSIALNNKERPSRPFTYRKGGGGRGMGNPSGDDNSES